MSTCKYSKQSLCSGKIPRCPAASHDLAGMLYSAAEEGICWQYLACDGGQKNEKSFWPKKDV